MRLAFKTRPQNIEWSVMLETWKEFDAGAYGISLAERFDRFEEYLACVVSLLSEPVTNFEGRFYPFSPIDPASVHNMADALEPLVETD
ncbi:MAG: hypothetical protein OXG67_03670 [bacterium]|nr:hypothetical protein [bacterium]MCY3888630.1 hypothetical protein [bacterium]